MAPQPQVAERERNLCLTSTNIANMMWLEVGVFWSASGRGMQLSNLTSMLLHEGHGYWRFYLFFEGARKCRIVLGII